MYFGWTWISSSCSNICHISLAREEMSENFERAAAIAVFQGRIRRGIASLKDGAGVAQQQGNSAKGMWIAHMTGMWLSCDVVIFFFAGAVLNLIALALSGYTPQEKKLWHETCAGVKAQVASPYLRAAFNFLCSSGRDQFKDVLVGKSIHYLDLSSILSLCLSLSLSLSSLPSPLPVRMKWRCPFKIVLRLHALILKMLYFTHTFLSWRRTWLSQVRSTVSSSLDSRMRESRSLQTMLTRCALITTCTMSCIITSDNFEYCLLTSCCLLP